MTCRELQVCCSWIMSGVGVSEIGGKGWEDGHIARDHRRKGVRAQVIPTIMTRERTEPEQCAGD